MSDLDFSREAAVELDRADPLSALRDEFEMPRRADGTSQAYFAGNSLGPLPRRSREAVQRVLDSWSTRAVGGHFDGEEPWYRHDEPLAQLLAPIVGAGAHEVALMGALTSNLHLLMASFFRPSGARRKILIEPHAFPSDRYAVASQVQWHGGDPARDVIVIETAHPDITTADDLAATLAKQGDTVAMALLGGVNYYTGQYLELEAMTSLLRAHGVVVGLDLAHAVGNVPLSLHDWDVDFAAWCTYKYLNAGPGALAGIFVHDTHGRDLSMPRLAGWWGNDPEIRFDMHAQDAFVPQPGAPGWKVSNPSVLAMAPLGAALELFDRVGMAELRERSLRLTAFLEAGVSNLPGVSVITPVDPAGRGCQLSVRIGSEPTKVEAELARRGVVVDARDPDVIRIAPAPLYGRFEEVVEVVEQLGDVLGQSSTRSR